MLLFTLLFFIQFFINTSSRRQGDVGMEGPRGGVGGPGETVRKHNVDFSVVETLFQILLWISLKRQNIGGISSSFLLKSLNSYWYPWKKSTLMMEHKIPTTF